MRPSGGTEVRTMPDPYVLAFFLAVGIALLILYSRLIAAIQGSIASYRGLNSTQEMLGNNYLCDSVRMIFLLLLPFYALTLVVAEVSSIGFFMTLALLVLLWLFCKIASTLLGWLGSRQGAMRSVEKTGYAVSIMAMLVSLIACIIGWLVPATPRSLLAGFLAVVAAIGFIVYSRRSFSIILSTGFSPFLWVLYLCALNFLPICVVVNILINGN